MNIFNYRYVCFNKYINKHINICLNIKLFICVYVYIFACLFIYIFVFMYFYVLPSCCSCCLVVFILQPLYLFIYLNICVFIFLFPFKYILQLLVLQIFMCFVRFLFSAFSFCFMMIFFDLDCRFALRFSLFCCCNAFELSVSFRYKYINKQ